MPRAGGRSFASASIRDWSRSHLTRIYLWLLTCTGGLWAKNCAGVSNLPNHFPSPKKWSILLNHPPNAQRKFAPLLTSYDSFKTSDMQYDFVERFRSICYSQNPYLPPCWTKVCITLLHIFSLFWRNPWSLSLSMEIVPSDEIVLLRCNFRTERTCCIIGNFQTKAFEIMPNAETEKLVKFENAMSWSFSASKL